MTVRSDLGTSLRDVSCQVTLSVAHPLAKSIGVTRVADITGLDRIGLPVVQAIRPNARSFALTQGKGLTSEVAEASALMETIEYYFAERVDVPLRHCSAVDHDTARRRRVGLDGLPRIDGRRPDPYRSGLWVEGRSLSRSNKGASCWVPYELVSLDQRVDAWAGDEGFAVSSNGLASGNSFYEAAGHALLELIERDAEAECAAGNTSQELRVLADPELAALVERLDANGVELRLVRIPAAIDVTVVRCDLRLRDEGSTTWGAGMGASPSPRRAVIRAICEAAQSRLAFISGARDDLFWWRYPSPDEDAIDTAETDDKGGVGIDELEHRNFESAEDEVDWLVDELERAGRGPPIAVQLTEADYPIQVVRCVVPGLDYLDEGQSLLGYRERDPRP